MEKSVYDVYTVSHSACIEYYSVPGLGLKGGKDFIPLRGEISWRERFSPIHDSEHGRHFDYTVYAAQKLGDVEKTEKMDKKHIEV